MKKMKYKAVVFDFDLTLADSTKGIYMCYKHTLKEFGYEIPTDEAIFKTIGMTLEQGFDQLTGSHDEERNFRMKQVYVKKADEVMVKNTFFYENTLAILQVLNNAGIKTGIVSTKFRYRIEDSFKLQAGSVTVDEIVGGGDVNAHKPDPEGLNLMIDRLGVDKEDVLYVGDSYIDAETAQNAGVDFGGVTTGSTSRETFEKYPHKIIADNLLELFQNI